MRFPIERGAALTETAVVMSPADRRRVRSRSALSLVEVAAILSVIGMLLAVAIPTLARSIRASKISEASEQLDRLYRSIDSYYATARPDANGNDLFCLPESAGPAPSLPSPAPVAVDFAAPATPGAATWSALGFAPKVPLRYRYSVVVPSPGCHQASAPHPNRIALRAEGDLDSDGIYSTFERRADVQSRGELMPDAVLHIQDRIE